MVDSKFMSFRDGLDVYVSSLGCALVKGLLAMRIQNLSSISSICKPSTSRGDIVNFILLGAPSCCLTFAAILPLMLVMVVDGLLQEQKFVELSPYASECG